MDNLHVYGGNTALAKAVALQTVNILHHALEEHGDAVWVLAGGSTPLLAYNIIATEYARSLDWTSVTIVMGDERMGAATSPHNNWHTISQILSDLPTKKLQPISTLSSEESARDYEKKLLSLPKKRNSLPRLDLVWLGVGPDGHTLSLFPEHPGLSPTDSLVVPVHDSPKPPADRISLSLRALLGTDSAMIIATGKDKREAITAAMSGKSLPIALAINVINTHGEHIEWFVDEAASPAR
jgi:6-phosphogluconolactonase